MATGIIKQIFADKWGKFKEKHSVRLTVLSEVKKMLTCKDMSEGYSKFCCPTCNEVRYIGFTCKSRFCTSCGRKATEQWVEKLSKELFEVPHRHMAFTIPTELRDVFLRERELLKLLSDCAAKTIISYLSERSKKQQPIPGIVCVIHTFGRDLKWNPYVHVLVTEGALRKDKQWQQIKYFHYEMLGKRWQHLLLKSLKEAMPKNKRIIQLVKTLYRQKEKGFYVHAKNRMKNVKGIAKYIGRYICRPAIAESRIESYDGEVVRFWYESHEDGKKIEEVLPVLEFIGKLVRHIPDKQFKMVRYYGVYSRNRKAKAKKVMSVWQKYRQTIYKRINWRKSIQKSFGYDPLICTKCGKEMILEDIVYKKYGSMLERMQEKMWEAYKREGEKFLNEYVS